MVTAERTAPTVQLVEQEPRSPPTDHSPDLNMEEGRALEEAVLLDQDRAEDPVVSGVTALMFRLVF